MASTPPPLPSSSDDSDFDDDDFGCFKSSAPPLKAKDTEVVSKTEESKIRENAEKNSPVNYEVTERSETTQSVNHEDSADESKEKPTEIDTSQLSSPPFDGNSHSSAVSYKDLSCNEEQISSSNTSDIIPSSESIEETKNSQNSSFPSGEIKNNDDHSINKEDEQNFEDSEKQICTNDGIVEDSTCDDDGEEKDPGPSENKQLGAFDSVNHSSDQVEESESISNEVDKDSIAIDDDDDFGDWSDMKTFQPESQSSDGTKDIDAANHSSYELNQPDCNGSVDLDKDNSNCADDSSKIGEENSVSEFMISHGNIPSESLEAFNTGHNQLSFTAGNAEADKDNDNDFDDSGESKDKRTELDQEKVGSDAKMISPQNDFSPIPTADVDNENIESSENSTSNNHNDTSDVDEDDFGDFADFSHQGFENKTTEKDVPPTSLKTSINNKEDEKGSDGDEKIDAVDFEESMEDDLENVDSEKIENDDEEDWGFKSADFDGNNKASDDDFGNFGSANNNNEEEDDWASFNDTSVTAVSAEDVDDFNDFSSTDFQTPPVSHQDSSIAKAQEGSSKVEKVVFLCFPPASLDLSANVSKDGNSSNKSDLDDSEVDDLTSVIEMGLKVNPHAKEETWTIVKDLRNKNPMVGTWGRLKDVNSSHALDYGWNSSHCCQEIFTTLHIDTQNVLFSQKKQAVPFYTSGLGILEPIRGGNPAEKSQPPLEPTLLDTEKSEEESKKVLDIPPVDFDWGSSGLTNPLKVFKADSFNTSLSSLDSFSDVLQKNLEPTKELSEEAKSILLKIPNLTFMRSNVLMFPIKD